MGTVKYKVCDRCGEQIKDNARLFGTVRRLKIRSVLCGYVSDHEMELCGACFEGLERFLKEKKSKILLKTISANCPKCGKSNAFNVQDEQSIQDLPSEWFQCVFCNQRSKKSEWKEKQE